jgi:hypothetical protein
MRHERGMHAQKKAGIQIPAQRGDKLSNTEAPDIT